MGSAFSYDLSHQLPGDAVQRITLLRHGEKEGREKVGGLSSTGRMRAFALPYLLHHVARRDGWPLSPDRLIAAHDTTMSHRPSLTLQHLSHALSLPIHQARGPADVLALLFGPGYAQAWRHAVVAWRHRGILGVAQALGAARRDLPPDWPAGLYDRMIVMDFNQAGMVLRTRCIYADDTLPVDNADAPTTIPSGNGEPASPPRETTQP